MRELNSLKNPEGSGDKVDQGIFTVLKIDLTAASRIHLAAIKWAGMIAK